MVNICVLLSISSLDSFMNVEINKYGQRTFEVTGILVLIAILPRFYLLFVIIYHAIKGIPAKNQNKTWHYAGGLINFLSLATIAIMVYGIIGYERIR